MISATAKMLERLLYTTAISSDSYKDLSTLEPRLKDINIRILQRRLQKRNRARKLSCSWRKKV
jgi:hypothetical protein